jgi:quercetin dioxygenase-like cupin family protein
MTATAKGQAKVLGPEDGASFWQPVPANGFVRCLFEAGAMGAGTPFSMGTQTVAEGCFVREHLHAEHDEMAYVIAGEGHLSIEGAPHPLVPNSACFIGRGLKHSFVNTGTGPLTFVWFILPGGLDAFFAAIGLPRQPGEPAPAPFPRPENIAEIEARSVFGWTDPRFAGQGRDSADDR